jgi:hypothetical protein
VVTTTRITHATPAATYAHAALRHWEADSNMNATLHKNCKDIAWQLVNQNHDIQVDFHQKDHPIWSPFTTNEGVLRTYPNLDPQRDWIILYTVESSLFVQDQYWLILWVILTLEFISPRICFIFFFIFRNLIVIA